MKLFEITKPIASLIAEFIKMYSDPKLAKDEWGGTINDVCEEAGNCAMVSETLDRWLHDEHDLDSEMYTGLIAKNPEWAKRVGVTAGSDDDAHTVLKIGSKIVDLTAKQFDKSLPFPRIISVADFKKEWKKVHSSGEMYL